MAAYTNSVSFYFKNSSTGNKNIIVATYNYVDDIQIEKIYAGSIPTPTSTPKATVVPTLVPTVAPTALPPTTNLRAINLPLYGVTTDSIDSTADIVLSLKNLSRFPTTRIVFDELVPANYYVSAANSIYPYSYIMGELLDSFAVKNYTTTQYKDRVTEYLNALGTKIDIWEIGNEINGEWLGDNASVVTKMTDAYNQVKAKGFRAALTLYYNDQCWAKSSNEMFTWARANIPSTMKNGLDFVLISYYEDDCNDLQPYWPTVFAKLHTMFPNSKIGFGEVGTKYEDRKDSYINRYYSMDITAPNYIGGYFWWYFKQDMTPYTKSHWKTLYDVIHP
jgi:hypothetical protein